MANEEKKKKTTTKKVDSSKKTQPTKKENITKKTTKSNSTSKEIKKAKVNIVQEENNYGRTILAAFLILIIFVGGYLGIQYKRHNDKQEEKYVQTADEKKFKEEYESLNSKLRKSGEKNKDIKIIEDNNIKYISLKEAAEILDSGSGVIYFGFAACPWCRNAVPVLLNAMDSTDLDTIYYVNIKPDDDAEKDLRDTYVLDNKNKPRKSRDAESAYYDILLALANDLNDYVLYTDKGKKVNTGEKRLAAPTVVSVLNGIVVGFHQGTLDNHARVDGVLPDLTKDEETELFNDYTKIITKYLNSDCGNDSENC